MYSTSCTCFLNQGFLTGIALGLGEAGILISCGVAPFHIQERFQSLAIVA